MSRKPVVYFMGSKDGPIKIGFSTSPKQRLRAMQAMNGEPLLIFATCEGGPELEREYHKRFAEHRLHGEWFAAQEPIRQEILRLGGRFSDWD